MVIEERVLKKNIMEQTKETLKMAANISEIFLPHAAAGLSNFLNNQGNTLYLEDAEVEDLFDKAPKSNKLRQDYIPEIRKAISIMLNVDLGTNFSMIKTASVNLPQNMSLDWRLLYGTYQFSVNGICFKDGNEYVAQGYFNVDDYYDFDKMDLLELYEFVRGEVDEGSTQFDKNDFLYSRMADLHYAGMARFYYIEAKDKGFMLHWRINENGITEVINE